MHSDPCQAHWVKAVRLGGFLLFLVHSVGVRSLAFGIRLTARCFALVAHIARLAYRDVKTVTTAAIGVAAHSATTGDGSAMFASMCAR